jgi:hypothetical protein
VDAALARLTPPAQAHPAIRRLGHVTKLLPSSQLAIGDHVVFVGKESDYQEARISKFVERVKVTIDRVDYNYGDLFEIESRTHMYFGRLSVGGDSGSWIIRESEGKRDELCGVLYAGNGKTSLCGFSDRIFGELNARFGVNLGLL